MLKVISFHKCEHSFCSVLPHNLKADGTGIHLSMRHQKILLNVLFLRRQVPVWMISMHSHITGFFRRNTTHFHSRFVRKY